MVKFLFPHRYKIYGLILFVTSLTCGILYFIFDFQPSFLEVKTFNFFNQGDILGLNSKNNFIDEIISLGIILGGILLGFSREKVEDEYITKIRLESLVWAVYVNFVILALSIIFISGLAFLNVMIFNMFNPLIFFILRFNIVLLLDKRKIKYEE